MCAPVLRMRVRTIACQLILCVRERTIVDAI